MFEKIAVLHQSNISGKDLLTFEFIIIILYNTLV